MKVTTRRMTACALAIAVLSGCGNGSNTDDPGLAEGADGVKAVVKTIDTGLREGNGARVCSLIDPGVQQKLEHVTKTADCPAAVTAWSKAHASQLAALPELTVTVTDARAVATASGADAYEPLTQGGKWHLNRVESRWNVTSGS